MTRRFSMLGLLLLLAFALRAYRLSYPDHPYFDEGYYVGAARDYLEGRPDANNVHPPLAKLEIAAGMLLLDGLKAYGCNPLADAWAWRIASLVSGMGTLALTYLLAISLGTGSRAALLAVFLLSFDFLSFAQARIATLDGIQCFWIVLALTLAVRGRLGPAALACGAATACKWNGLFAALAVWLWWVSCKRSWREALKAAVVLGLGIASVYLTSYAFVFARSHSAGEALREIWGYHVRMWRFRHDPFQFHHRYLSPFWQWPLVVRPVWYLFETDSQGWEHGIVGMGCPLFWWAADLLLLDLIFLSRCRGDRTGRFLVLSYLSLWLPWALTPIGGFQYYLLPVAPLMAIILARELADWWEEPLSRSLAMLYLGAVVLVFFVYYPFLTGASASPRAMQWLFAPKSWI